MKRLPLTATCAIIAVVTLRSTSVAQTAAAAKDQQQLALAIKELQEQQAAIAQNEAKIDQKVAAIAEAVRQARIFANRAGAGKR